MEAREWSTRNTGINGGAPFECVRVTLRAGSAFECVRSHASHAAELHFWRRHSPLLETLPMDAVATVEPIDLGRVPPSVYVLAHAKTGGIGPHVRMQVLLPSGDLDTPCTLIVTDVDERYDELDRFAAENAEYVVLEADARCYVVEGMCVAKLVVRKRRNMQLLIARLAWLGFESYCLNTKDVRVLPYIPEKMTRYRHQWREDSGGHAMGPVRDTWRWRISHLPPHWSAVYTMEDHAREIGKDVCAGVPPLATIRARVDRVVQPLRSLVCRQIARWTESVEADVVGEAEALGAAPPQEEATEEARAHGERLARLELKRRRLGAIRESVAAGAADHVSVHSLSRDQMVQLLECVYSIDYAPYTPAQVERLRDVVFVYALHGHAGRILGVYTRHNEKRGLGKTLRIFRGETEDSRNLAVESLNRVRRTADGQVVGVGGRGYKGIYPLTKGDCELYQPKWRTRRTSYLDEAARTCARLA